MTYSEIQKHHNDILEAVIGRRLSTALTALSRLSVQVGSSDIHNRYQSISDTFHNMLKYSFEFAPDPERNRIYTGLRQSILELSDDIRETWIQQMGLFERKYALERYREFESQYADKPGLVSTQLSENKLISSDISDPVERHRHDNDFVTLVFYYLWLKRSFSENTVRLVDQVIENPDVHDTAKSMVISAVTISMLRHFDRHKFIILFDYSSHDNPEIRQRAMIGLFLVILMYQRRLGLYEDLIKRLESIQDDKTFQERMLAILIQFIRASETEQITRKIQEEIVPEVIKMRSELDEKLNLDELLSKDNFEDKNPEWKNFFKDAPDVYQKLEQFSKMQIEGADVFMGAFAMLKHFSFFKELPNWFMPFSAKNPEVLAAFDNVEEELDIPAFLEGLEQSTVLCNSDKYSFCLNIRQLPGEQRKMMLELFNMELKAMNEMMEEEFTLNAETKNKIVNTQYFHDIYRFFKLHPSRKEYLSLFEQRVDIFKSKVFRIIFEDPKLIRNLGEYYFAKDRYEEARELFSWLNEKKQSFELLEKLGFCYQKTGNFSKAIELYTQAELFDRDKVWLRKKLGYCYRKTGDFRKAIEYYKEIIGSDPHDLNNLAYLGQLHMDIEDFNEALQYYYKVEYEAPENERVYRPIAWCSFVLGKHDNALKYFEKVVKLKPGKDDYLNLGHCFWASGNVEQALISYRTALRLSSGDKQWFRDVFSKDSKYLLATGKEELDIHLMADYVLLEV
ncbi:MAG: tetratricopeptide repeat protein [Bacteroidales bacterium]|nr:tetratricopeptide repeat protein [Bacteroidales bacterium]